MIGSSQSSGSIEWCNCYHGLLVMEGGRLALTHWLISELLETWHACCWLEREWVIFVRTPIELWDQLLVLCLSFSKLFALRNYPISISTQLNDEVRQNQKHFNGFLKIFSRLLEGDRHGDLLILDLNKRNKLWVNNVVYKLREVKW